MIPSWETRNGDKLTLPYHSHTQNQQRFGPKTNNGRRNYNNQRSFRSESKPFQQEQLGDKRDIRSVDAEKRDSVPETQQCPSTIDLKKLNNPKCNDIVDLAKCEKHIPLNERKSQPSVPNKSLNGDDEIADCINELEQLTSNEPRNWQKPFPLDNQTFVTIVHCVVSPTINCYVVQNQHTTKRKHLLDELKRLQHNDEAVECDKVTTNEVYCVQYENIYYRGCCLYKINSKEVLVRLIDVGLTFQTSISALRRLDARLKTIHAFAFEINFETLLDVCVGQTLRIESFSVDATGDAIHVTVAQDEKMHQQIELVPLPIGVPMEMFCLDYSNVDKGYITACEHNPEKIESINRLSDKIVRYLKNLGTTAGQHCPKVDEVCLVYHDSEHQWYRAECIKEMSADRFEMLFIDYGNTRMVSSCNIRKFVSEFAEPAIMHFCCIQGEFYRSVKCESCR